MTAMRDKLIHGYFGVDAEVIGRTAREACRLFERRSLLR